MRAILLAVGLAACGRIDFDLRATDVDSGVDGVDAALPSDLVAYYRMEPLGGAAILVDSTGHHHDAQCTSCPTTVMGRIDQALAFDGEMSLGVVPSTPDLELRAGFTVAGWVKLDVTPVDRACVATKGLAMTYRNSWAVCVETDLRLFFFTSTAAADDNLFSVATVSLGAWHHLAIRWDGMRKTSFLDGTEVATSLAAADFDTDSVRLGGDIDAAPVALFGGAIDDLRIYSRALGDGEISALANP